MEYITESFEETQELGEEIGSSLIGGEVLALSGDLGSGKTTFMQGLAKGLGIEKNLNSPTFIIVRTYEVEKDKINKLYHVDLYRLEEGVDQEMENLGLLEEMENAESVVAIEWAEKAKDLLPEKTKWIRFEQLDEERRRIKVDD